MPDLDFIIHTKKDLISAVARFGFLPFFTNQIEGFSIEEHCEDDVWYQQDGSWKVWEWKGPLIRECGFAYGKFFAGKAAFVSRKWFPDFANYRRDGYDFEGYCEDGFVSHRDKELYNLINENAPISSRALKNIGNYRKGGKKGFETIITRLQSQCFVLVSDFTYARNKNGDTYGWGIAEYSTPEKFFGEDFCNTFYESEPEESYKKILRHMHRLFPEEDAQVIRRMLG